MKSFARKALKPLMTLSLIALTLGPAAAMAQVKFRVPLNMLNTQCGGGKCYPTAHFDTNQSWGYYRDYACQVKTYNQHDGTDYGIGGFWAMDQGKFVKAAAGGTVIAVHDGEFDRCTSGRCGMANFIKIRHVDGKETWYWHLKRWSIRVKLGQWVSCGTDIAQVGSSGYSTGPHLHFGTRAPNGVMDDPYKATSSACGGGYSWWTNQGWYGGLPGLTCTH